MDLIPGIPNDVGLECLIRVPFDQLPVAASVCRKWNDEIMKAEFRQRRRDSGLTRPVIAMAQAMVDSGGPCSQIYRITLFDPVKGCRYDLPPIPEMVGGLPVFSRLLGIGPDLAVVGGCDPETCGVLNSVFIYSFLTASWRRGNDMPGEQRLFFGCAASEKDGVMVVAGGSDGIGNALKSALAYNVGTDAWTPLPDMSSGRDECACVFHKGKFHAIGRYDVDTPGQFKQRTAEALGLPERSWCTNDNTLEATTNYTSSAGAYVEIDGRLYTSGDGDVVMWGDDTWRVIAKVPKEASNVSFLTGWQGMLMVMGNEMCGQPQRAFVLELKSHIWSKLEAPNEYSGHVQSGFCLYLILKCYDFCVFLLVYIFLRF